MKTENKISSQFKFRIMIRLFYTILLYCFCPIILQAQNNCLHFDEIPAPAEYVDIGMTPNTTFIDNSTRFSVECWANLSNVSTQQILVSNSQNGVAQGFELRVVSGEVYLTYRDNDGTQYVSNRLNPSANTWHHFVGVLDGNQLYCYMDGVGGTPTTTGGLGIVPAVNSLKIGGNASFNRYCYGMIDEVRIWNKALCVSEVTSNANCELTGSESSLIAYYNFNQGTAGGNNAGLTTLTDLSPNNYNGTLVNFTLNGGTSNWLDASANGVSGTCVSSEPEINVQGNSNNIIDGQTTISASDYTDFGNIEACNGNISLPFNIQNTGGASLNISSINSSNTDFTISSIPTTIAGNSSQSFTISFDPSSISTINSTITINSNDCDEGVYTFSIEGVGTSDVTKPEVGIATALVYGQPNSGGQAFFEIRNESNNLINSPTLSFNSSGEPIIDISPDNTKIYIPIRTNGVSVVDPNTNTEIAIMPSSGGLSLKGFEVDNTGLFGYGLTSTSSIIKYDLSTESPIATLSLPGSGNSLDVSSDGTRMVVGSNTGNAYIINLTTFTVIATVPIINAAWGRHNTAIFPDNSKAYVLSYSNPINGRFTVNEIDLTTNTRTRDFEVTAYESNTYAPVVISSDNLTAYIGGNNHISVVDVVTGTETSTIPATFNRKLVLYDNDTKLSTGSAFVDLAGPTVTSTITSQYSYALLNKNLCTDINVTLDGTGNYTLTSSDINTIVAGSSDNCSSLGNITFTPSQTVFTCADAGLAIPITVNGTDQASNIGTCTATINVGDLAKMTIQGNGNSITNGQTLISTSDNTDYGTYLTCTTPITHSFTIQNTGTTALNISSILSSNGVFNIIGAPSVVAVSSSANFDIVFNPISNGTETSTITINSDNCGGGVFTFNVEGIATNNYNDLVRGDVLDFDGSNDNVSVLDDTNLDFSTSLTLETWVQFDVMPGSLSGLISKYDTDGNNRAYFLGVFNDGRITFSLSNTGTSAIRMDAPAGTITAGQWYHIAVTHDVALGSNNTKMYVNGILVQQNTNTNNIFNSAANLYLGAYDNGGNGLNGGANINFLNGKMDEVRLWNLSRSANQIRENMHLTLNSCNSGLVAYYQMNDGTGSSTLTDKSGNGNTGTLTNMAPASDWITSGVNVGNDASSNSVSQTITAITSGMSTQNFAAANLEMRFFAHSGTEDITVTYQEFTPNAITGIDGFNIIQNPMWTVNKSSITETMLVDYTFTFPAATFTSLDPTKYALFWRAMYDDGAWTKIATAHSITSTTAGFGKLNLDGQFLVVQESDVLVSDVRGNMYEFDGVDDHINLGNLTNTNFGTNDFTIEFWVKTNYVPVGQSMALLSKRSVCGCANFWNIRMQPDGRFFLELAEASCTNYNFIPSNTIINDNAWHHIAIVRTGGTVDVYLDGNLDNSQAVSNTNLSNSDDVHLGRDACANGVNGFHMTGAMDEVRFWNVARSRNEIRENIHLTLKGNESNLAHYYQFNNDAAVGTANGVKDALGVNDGTTQNMASTSYQASEVAVAGGTSDRMTIGAVGTYNFSNTDVDIEFGATTPNGEIVISRLETEKPHGWASIDGDVDDEYLVINNYGTNQTFSPLVDLSINRMSYISSIDLAQPQSTSPLNLYKRNDRDFGATWGSSWGGADGGNAGTNGAVSYNTTNNLTSFSQIVIVNSGPNSDLPVELLNFDIERINPDQVQLDWSTATETNNKGFYIERMLEIEGEFEAIAFVDGQGTTVNTSYYQFLDENGYTGVSYYRLRQVDFDGTINYSPIKVVAGMGQNNGYIDALVYPNPVSDELRIRFNELPDEASSAQVQILSTDGKILQNFDLDIQSYQVHKIETVKELTPAMYMISIEMNNGKKVIQKFIKE